jgi:prevent-host-death family protein
MDYLQFTELRNSAKEYFDKVEKGKSFVIIRKGRPIAKVVPFNEPLQGWKREIKRVKLKSGTDSSLVLRQLRDEE